MSPFSVTLFYPEDLLRLVLAMVVGGLIGMEREIRDKDAGFRTMMLICTGATLFTVFSIHFSGNFDSSRIAANIVSGIGFLGAGVIIQRGGQIKGLTTASTIWLVAALGMGIGAGYWAFVLFSTGIILVILWAFPLVERWMESFSETRNYQITIRNESEKYVEIDSLWKQHKLRVIVKKIYKDGDQRICRWKVVGRPSRQNVVLERLLADEDVLRVEY